MPVDLLIRSQLLPKERLQSYKSKRAKILKDFTDSKFFTILILNKIIKSILCKFCLQRMLHQSSSDAFFIGSCRPFFCGNGVVRTWKTKKIGVWFSLALFVTNQKIKPIQDGIQNKGYIANFYIVIVLECQNVWFFAKFMFLLTWPDTGGGPIQVTWLEPETLIFLPSFRWCNFFWWARRYISSRELQITVTWW